MEADKIEEVLKSCYLNSNETTPPWALMIIELLKQLLKQGDTITNLANRILLLEDCKVINERVSDELKSENDKLKEKIKCLTLQVDDQEQRSRNGCLLFHGVPEEDNDDTDKHTFDIVTRQLGVELSLDDIQRSHRVGPKRAQSNVVHTRAATKTFARPIIVRFTSYRKRHEIFHAKRALRGKSISISENLTKLRYNLLKAAITKYGFGKVWTNEGRVTTKVNNNYIVINSLEDLHS